LNRLQVASFIVIELALFPLGCGIVLDCCTIWLFPEASLLSRSLFFLQAPLTAMFYHWVAGTMFMYVFRLIECLLLNLFTRYSFAILLSGCRSIMRPGAMWFIKDPQDQNSHPIRDILDRPTLLQLRKILVSAVMYALVVTFVIGSVAGLLLLGSKSIMPFRWKNRSVLSSTSQVWYLPILQRTTIGCSNRSSLLTPHFAVHNALLPTCQRPSPGDA
jgi:E3 ubiquitin-protein ligase MARCH6